MGQESTRSITFFPVVGNGNCCLLVVDDVVMAFDLKGDGDKTSYQQLRPYLPMRDGKRHLDVLCTSHGDMDHCGDFTVWRGEIDQERLVIGTIWHPDFDRTETTPRTELPADYLALHEEIERRKGVKSPTYGDLQAPLKAGDTEEQAFVGVTLPSDLTLRVLHPTSEDLDDPDWDENDCSLVIQFTLSGLTLLFAGDASAKSWQERIIPDVLEQNGQKRWARATVLVAAHHGSFTFFGCERDAVRDADPAPDNYEALDYIQPSWLVVSSEDEFPTCDNDGDMPPHYAAYKWYLRWFRENRDVSESDEDPDQFKYTARGPVRLEYGPDGTWRWNTEWTPSDDPTPLDDEEKAQRVGVTGFRYREGQTQRGGGQYA